MEISARPAPLRCAFAAKDSLRMSIDEIALGCYTYLHIASFRRGLFSVAVTILKGALQLETGFVSTIAFAPAKCA
jgi:hypothetical protein